MSNWLKRLTLINFLNKLKMIFKYILKMTGGYVIALLNNLCPIRDATIDTNRKLTIYPTHAQSSF